LNLSDSLKIYFAVKLFQFPFVIRFHFAPVVYLIYYIITIIFI
jgi:hypothetical protein